MILLLDHYDSFVYSLGRYVEELGAKAQVRSVKDISVADIEFLRPTGIILSPGPGTPDEAHMFLTVIRRFGSKIPMLGVCLGCQCMARVFGADVRPVKPVHAATSLVYHHHRSIFKTVPSPFTAARYHSLLPFLPEGGDLKPLAWLKTGELMALAHRRYPLVGVQFHPESVLTRYGHTLLQAFLDIASAYPRC